MFRYKVEKRDALCAALEAADFRASHVGTQASLTDTEGFDLWLANVHKVWVPSPDNLLHVKLVLTGVTYYQECMEPYAEQVKCIIQQHFEVVRWYFIDSNWESYGYHCMLVKWLARKQHE